MQIISVSQPTRYAHSHSNSNSDESVHRIDEDDINSRAIVAVDTYYSPFPFTPSYTPDTFSSIIHYNEDPPPPQPPPVVETKPSNSAAYHGGDRERERILVIEKVNLGVRVLELAFCLISFSVLVADTTQGWSGNSFHRYKEYRFCVLVNVLGFLYAAFQAFDAGNHLATGKHVINHHLRYQFDFIMDQILAYLLISASSAAASKVDDWQTNWGKDLFTEKASASVSMAFLAFLGFAMTSLISGYNLCNRYSF